ncbi:MAG: hypothetical protein ACXV8R_15860, partial [Acidimicrobiia bacterium]
GQLGAQVIDGVVGFIWAWGVVWVIFSIVKHFSAIRVTREAEIEGIDMPEFGAYCYPDFVLQRETYAGDEDELEGVGVGNGGSPDADVPTQTS